MAQLVAQRGAQVQRAGGGVGGADVPAVTGRVVVDLDLECAAFVSRARQHQRVDSRQVHHLEADLVQPLRQPGIAAAQAALPEPDRRRHLAGQLRCAQGAARHRARGRRAGGHLAQRQAALEVRRGLLGEHALELVRVLEAAVRQHRADLAVLALGPGKGQRVAQDLEVDGGAGLHRREVEHVFAAHAVDDVVAPAVAKVEGVDAGIADQHVVALAAFDALDVGQRGGLGRRGGKTEQTARGGLPLVVDGDAAGDGSQCTRQAGIQRDRPGRGARADHTDTILADAAQAGDRLLDRVGVRVKGQRARCKRAQLQGKHAAIGHDLQVVHRLACDGGTGGNRRRRRCRRRHTIGHLVAAHGAEQVVGEAQVLGLQRHRPHCLGRGVLELDLPGLRVSANCHDHRQLVAVMHRQCIQGGFDVGPRRLGVARIKGDGRRGLGGGLLLRDDGHRCGGVGHLQREGAAGGPGQVQQLDLVLALLAGLVHTHRRHPQVDGHAIVGVLEGDAVVAGRAVDRVDAEQAQVEDVVALIAGQRVVVLGAAHAREVGHRVVGLQLAQRVDRAAQQTAQTAQPEALHAVGTGVVPVHAGEGAQHGDGDLGNDLEVGGGVAIDRDADTTAVANRGHIGGGHGRAGPRRVFLGEQRVDDLQLLEVALQQEINRVAAGFARARSHLHRVGAQHAGGIQRGLNRRRIDGRIGRADRDLGSGLGDAPSVDRQLQRARNTIAQCQPLRLLGRRGTQVVGIVQRQLALRRQGALDHRAAVHEDLRAARTTDDVLDVVGHHHAADGFAGVRDAEQGADRAVGDGGQRVVDGHDHVRADLQARAARPRRRPAAGAVHQQLERGQVLAGHLPDVDAHVGGHGREVQRVVADLQRNAVDRDVGQFSHRGGAPEARELVGVAARPAGDQVHPRVPVHAQQAAQVDLLDEAVQVVVAEPVISLCQQRAGHALGQRAAQERHHLVRRRVTVELDRLAQGGIGIDLLAQLGLQSTQDGEAAADLEGVGAEREVAADQVGQARVPAVVDQVRTLHQVQARPVLQVLDVLHLAGEAADLLRVVERRVRLDQGLGGVLLEGDQPAIDAVARHRKHLVVGRQLGVQRALDLVGGDVPVQLNGGLPTHHQEEVVRQQIAAELLHLLGGRGAGHLLERDYGLGGLAEAQRRRIQHQQGLGAGLGEADLPRAGERAAAGDRHVGGGRQGIQRGFDQVSVGIPVQLRSRQPSQAELELARVAVVVNLLHRIRRGLGGAQAGGRGAMGGADHRERSGRCWHGIERQRETVRHAGNFDHRLERVGRWRGECGGERGLDVGYGRRRADIPRHIRQRLAGVGQRELVAGHRCGEGQRVLLERGVAARRGLLHAAQGRIGVVHQRCQVQVGDAAGRRAGVLQDERVGVAAVAAAQEGRAGNLGAYRSSRCHGRRRHVDLDLGAIELELELAGQLAGGDEQLLLQRDDGRGALRHLIDRRHGHGCGRHGIAQGRWGGCQQCHVAQRRIERQLEQARMHVAVSRPRVELGHQPGLADHRHRALAVHALQCRLDVRGGLGRIVAHRHIDGGVSGAHPGLEHQGAAGGVQVQVLHLRRARHARR